MSQFPKFEGTMKHGGACVKATQPRPSAYTTIYITAPAFAPTLTTDHYRPFELSMGNNHSVHLHHHRHKRDDSPSSNNSSQKTFRTFDKDDGRFTARGANKVNVDIPNPAIEIDAIDSGAAAQPEITQASSQTLTTTSAKDDRPHSIKRNSVIKKDQKEMSSQATVPCQVCYSSFVFTTGAQLRKLRFPSLALV